MSWPWCVRRLRTRPRVCSAVPGRSDVRHGPHPVDRASVPEGSMMGKHSAVVEHSARRRTLGTAGIGLGTIAAGAALGAVGEGTMPPEQAGWELTAQFE